ncbi:MAG: NAD(P)H-dependent oxidoreductase [Fimbriimonadaceae bacterium]|nr:NAD(P)H-dependent oxidoreductase [Fimbriimonadaceae bacterium]
MRPTVLLFHPNRAASRANHAFALAAERAGYAVRDLYAEYAESPIRIAPEQSERERETDLVLLHPFHWYSAPWLLKRYLDEVLTYGWAYGERTALSGKRWRQAITVGASEPEYRPGASRQYSVAEFLRPFERTAAFCQMPYDPFYRHGAGYVSDSDLSRWSSEFVDWLRS